MRILLSSMILALTCSAAVPVVAAPPVARSASGFDKDPKAVTGGWAEPQMMYSQPHLSLSGTPLAAGTDIDQFVTGPRLAYGNGRIEAGLLVPYVRSLRSPGKNREGFGDVEIFGKFIAIDNDMGSIGGGMVLITPSGDEDLGLGYGEVGFEPFGTAALRASANSPIELRAAGGYRFFADDRRSQAFGREPGDAIFYRAGLFIGSGEAFALRVEFVGESIDVIGKSDPMQIEPGIDIHMPTQWVNVIFRPTGLVGLNPEAPDWGLGLGIAVTLGGDTGKSQKDPGLPF